MRMLACAIDFYRVREVKEDQILNPTRGDVEATTVKVGVAVAAVKQQQHRRQGK